MRVVGPFQIRASFQLGSAELRVRSRLAEMLDPDWGALPTLELDLSPADSKLLSFAGINFASISD